ncbi:MAG TPA: hypothetical protein VGH65_01175 [Verrucomicrobiaceae bacterium]
MKPAILLLSGVVFLPGAAGAGDTASNALKKESFDHDPKWEAVNNRVSSTITAAAEVTQNFGYSATSFASRTKGEIGGTVWRAVQPAWYADKIESKTLDDKLSASGTFAITERGSSAAIFGWFNSNQIEGTSRPLQSLGLQIGTSKNGGVVHIRLHTGQNQSAGMLIPPKEGKKEHGTFRNDGTRYTWKLDYDPQAADGKGRVAFTIRSNLPKPEPFEDQIYSFNLPAGYKKQGTVFDRFGLINGTKPGGRMTVYFGDLERDGKPPDLKREPPWEAVGNRATAAKGNSANDFGFSETNHAGGNTGEIGGTIWRMGKLWGSYADRIGPLTLDDKLEASGRAMLEVGAPDSGVFFGWFKNCSQEFAPDQTGSFLGVKIAGPSRVGHYFAPSLTTARGTSRTAAKAPVLVPGRAFDFNLSYDPLANEGRGSIRVKLGDESATFELKKDDKAQGGEFDRFGIFSIHNDGGHAPVRIWFDDLSYTVARAK